MADPIAALIAASKEATPGPAMWDTRDDPYLATMSEIDTERDDMGYVIASYPKAIIDCLCRAGEADQEFIVAAYDPALVPALEALQARVTLLEAALRDLVGTGPGPDMPDDYPGALTVFAGDVRRARALLGRE